MYCDDRDFTRIPVHKRNFGLVFQSYALFPHLNVYENVAFGLKLRKMDKATIEKKVTEILKVCDLTEFKKIVCLKISPAVKDKEVALARALVIEPELLLWMNLYLILMLNCV